MGVFKTAVSVALFAICIAGNAQAEGQLNSVNIRLNPDGSYKLAKAVFLPEAGDGLGFAGRDLDSDHNQGDNCAAYTLNSCPAHGSCTNCPFNYRKKKLNKCDANWKVSGNSCVPNSCQAINSAYKTTIPTNNICSKTTEYGLTCYKDCRSISCGGYNIDCDTARSAANVSSYEECADCKSANASCSPSKCKITGCSNNMKVNANGTACILKDDTCPNNYFKSCEYGTTGSPEYTERGTACYQCKPRVLTCAERGLENMDICYIIGGTNYGPLSAWTPANMGR